ncbi:phage minor capsid protein [Nocardiopsis synnemataformans]|uniref:phage minor capsid protein n=1 Tax=Nocardiopsis synnemataformans TaxID=61305 RepID=UPI003EC0C25B
MPGVDPDDIEEITAQVGAIYREGELALYRQVSRHLDRYPGASTARAGEARLESVGALSDSVRAIQQRLRVDGSRALREGLARAWQLGSRSALVDIPAAWWPRSPLGSRAAAARAQVPQSGAIEALAASLVRDVGAVVANVLRQALDAYRSAVAGGAARMLAGGQSRREATQAAWAALVDRGVFGFTDRSGRRWRLSSYTEMAMRTASARAAVTGQDDRLATLDIDLVWISDHAQECELCRPWEGRILHRVSGPSGPLRVEHALEDDVWLTVDVAGSVPEARARGLWHPNCRHSMSAYLPGVTRVPEGKPDPKGYEARMRQRAIERNIRKWKEKQAASFTDEAKQRTSRKVRAWQAEMRKHLAVNPGLKRLSYREQIGGGNTRRNVDRAGQGWDPATPLEPNTATTLDGETVVAPRSSANPEQQAAADQAWGITPGQAELGQLDRDELRALSDEDLEARVADRIREGDYESARLVQLRDEMDRRDRNARQREERRRAREEREAAQHARLDELLTAGVPFEEAMAEVLGTSPEAVRRQEFTRQQRAGESDRRSFTQLAREQYRLHIERVYVAAETELRGVMLNAEGEAAGIDPMSLFSGPRSRAERYASEELRAWWDAHGRTTFQEFVDGIEQGRQTGDPGRDYNR